ncbi:MAG: hypothetical protein HC819_14835 [Cyclobacteriaceae bacterium]|nr:hypothetical protein [Cyclobacteriaceae bacterium]
MAETRSIGLKSIKMGAIDAGGGMGTVLTALGVTYRGTGSFTVEDATRQEFFSEENNFTAEETIISEPGLTQLKFAIINVAPDALQRVFGGTVTGDKWSAPRDIFEVEQSVEVITSYNVKIEIPRAKISARINWNLSRTEIAQVEITAVVLTPTLLTAAPYSIEQI